MSSRYLQESGPRRRVSRCTSRASTLRTRKVAASESHPLPIREHRLTLGVARHSLLLMKAIPLLGHLETTVLDFLWENSPGDAKAVHQQIGIPRKITLNTVQSTLERLHRKGLLLREKVGHAYVYAPALSKEVFRARAMAQAAGDLQGAGAAGVLAAFVDLASRADGKNLDHLEALIAAARKRRRGA